MTEQNRKWAKLSPEKREAIKATREKKLVEASARLSSGVKALLKKNRWKEYLNFSLKFHQYSFANTMLIMLQRPDAKWVASFNTWKSMGRYVKMDEHGIEIFVPMLVKYRHKAEKQVAKDAILDPDATIAESVKDDSQENQGKNLVGFKIGYVFDVSQTDGDQFPERPYRCLAGDDAGMFFLLKAAIEESQHIPVTFSSLPPGTFGCCRYDPDQDYRPKAITISDDPSLSGAQRLDTLAHEAGHAILHTGLEYRQHTDRSIHELEGESVSFCVLAALGVDTSQMSFGYIATWADSSGKDAVEEIERSGQRILEASRSILSWINEKIGVQVELNMVAKEIQLTAT